MVWMWLGCECGYDCDGKENREERYCDYISRIAK